MQSTESTVHPIREGHPGIDPPVAGLSTSQLASVPWLQNTIPSRDLRGKRLLLCSSRRLSPVVYEPLELPEKLSALVPAPRAHLVRYAGVLAPASKWRSSIVPPAAAGDSAADTADVTAVSIGLPHPMIAPVEHVGVPALPCASSPRGRNYSWAEWMRRVGNWTSWNTHDVLAG